MLRVKELRRRSARVLTRCPNGDRETGGTRGETHPLLRELDGVGGVEAVRGAAEEQPDHWG